jgi:hypothetical protein
VLSCVRQSSGSARRTSSRSRLPGVMPKQHAMPRPPRPTILIWSHRLCVVLVCMAACSLRLPPPPRLPQGGRSGTAAGAQSAAEVQPAAKIASAVSRVVQRMRADGITADNAAARQTESYSTPLMRVDQHGNLHVVLLVATPNAGVVSRLEQHGVRIEFVHTELRMIQAWVPFDRLERIAELPFVRSIRPPSYASRR